MTACVSSMCCIAVDTVSMFSWKSCNRSCAEVSIVSCLSTLSFSWRRRKTGGSMRITFISFLWWSDLERRSQRKGKLFLIQCLTLKKEMFTGSTGWSWRPLLYCGSKRCKPASDNSFSRLKIPWKRSFCYHLLVPQDIKTRPYTAWHIWKRKKGRVSQAVRKCWKRCPVFTARHRRKRKKTWRYRP